MIPPTSRAPPGLPGAVPGGTGGTGVAALRASCFGVLLPVRASQALGQWSNMYKKVGESVPIVVKVSRCGRSKETSVLLTGRTAWEFSSRDIFIYLRERIGQNSVLHSCKSMVNIFIGQNGQIILVPREDQILRSKSRRCPRTKAPPPLQVMVPHSEQLRSAAAGGLPTQSLQ